MSIGHVATKNQSSKLESGPPAIHLMGNSFAFLIWFPLAFLAFSEATARPAFGDGSLVLKPGIATSAKRVGSVDYDQKLTERSFCGWKD